MKLLPRTQGQIERQEMTISTAVTPFGCCNFFDSCTDGIFNLTWNGRLPLLDWMGFNVTDECYKSVEFITYNRPEQTGGVCTPGYLADPCGTPNGYELGAADLTVEDFGRVGRAAPTRDITKQHLKYCATRPRYRLDGTVVQSEDEWDMLFAMDQVLADVSKLLITGNATTGGQFDGLQRWVSTQYDPMLDSYVINWNSNDMDGGAGITINGTAIAATFDIVDVLLSLFRRIRQRAGWSAMLRSQRPRLGDFILVLPTFAIDCLLDFYTCWSVCAGQQFSEANLNTYEARTFRDRLIAADNPDNLFGYGVIRLDGIAVPLLAYDFELITGDTTFDMYFLTGSYGGFRVWEGQHLSADAAVRNAMTMGNSNPGYFSADGGRVLGYKAFDMLCKQLYLWMFPRLFCYAPWMQMRFQNVVCAGVLDPLAPDPCSSYYPITSFTPAVCP